MKPRTFKLLCGAMTILFVFWAGFQYNDPDVSYWMAFYGVAAVFSAVAFFDRLPRLAALGLGIAALVAVVYLATRVIGQEPIFEERGREMMGAAIVGIWMIVLYNKLPRPD